MNRTYAQPGRPLCIVLSDGTRLAVPPMHPKTPPYVRQQVFDAVLRRQFGLGHTVADIEREIIEMQEQWERAMRRIAPPRPRRVPNRHPETKPRMDHRPFEKLAAALNGKVAA